MPAPFQDLNLILYGRSDCCLCDRLESLITPHLYAWREKGNVILTKRDVEDDRHWFALYGDRIPVLTAGGNVVLEGRPEPETVAAVFAGLINKD